MMNRIPRIFQWTTALVLATVGTISAQDGWKTPPDEILSILDAPPSPSLSLAPNGQQMIIVHRVAMPPLADLGRTMWRLAGMRLNPDTNGRHGYRIYSGLTLSDLEGNKRPIALPDDSDVSSPVWSPNGQSFAFTITRPAGIDLWVGDVETAKAKKLVQGLNGASGSPFQWMPDSHRLLVRLVPEGRGPRPSPPAVPAGPAISEVAGEKAPVRTYQDLLSSPYDEARFEWIMQTQFALVDIRNGQRNIISAPGLYTQASPSPDGEQFLVTHITKPYSYLVSARSFPDVTEVWSISPKRKVIAKRPLRDKVPIGGVPTGPRSITWQATAPATLVWVEALDGGDPKAEVPHRDRIVTLDLSKTHDATPVEVGRTEYRCRGVSFLANSSLALVSSMDRKRRWRRAELIDVAHPDTEAKRVVDGSIYDRYGDPGRPVTRRNAEGKSVIHVDDGGIFLRGSGSSPEGDRPFLDRMDLNTLETTRLWRCAKETYESVQELVSRDGHVLLTQFETKTEPPNTWLRNLNAGTRKKITDRKDPAPQLKGVKKELVRYTRDDGTELSAMLYLPPDYKEGERRPLVVWAYPREFTDAKMAGQVSGSPHRFTQLRGTSHLFFLLRGYAIMDRAAMPIIGPGETANNTFREQVVASADAAIKKAADMGVADPERVGVGGHSYGAFMTANLLAHSDLFKAGIARSGAYNRSLTPFGFQNERRTFWEAPEIYFKVSPFMHADKINEKLLLIHGERDNNSGTFPIQSKRLFHAIKGHGGHARLVMLPYESHGYRARESVLHVVAEMLEWFDEHVRGPVDQ